MENVCLIQLPKIEDDRGNLSFFENNAQIPFEIRRVFWVYDVPGGEQRGGHAYRNTQEFIIALSGSFDVVLSDGHEEKKITLNRSYYGLFIPKMVWRQFENFSTNALALISSDRLFEPDEYIRNLNEFNLLVHGK